MRTHPVPVELELLRRLDGIVNGLTAELELHGIPLPLTVVELELLDELEILSRTGGAAEPGGPQESAKRTDNIVTAPPSTLAELTLGAGLTTEDARLRLRALDPQEPHHAR